jgi:hypothetical protein
VKTIDGIKVAIDTRILSMTEELTLDVQDDGLVFKGLAESDCC